MSGTSRQGKQLGVVSDKATLLQVEDTRSPMSRRRTRSSHSFSTVNAHTIIWSYFPQNLKVRAQKLFKPRHGSILIFCRSGLGPALTTSLLLKFLKWNGNIVLALSASSPTPSALASLLLELEIHLPPDRSSLVIDHFNYDELASPEKHDVLLLPRPEALRRDVINYFGGDPKKNEVIVLPRAVGHVLGNDSPLLAPVLRAPSTAYGYNPKDEAATVEEVFATGSQLSLVSTLQARNSARFVVLGSVEMLEDTWFDAQVQSSPGADGKTKNAKKQSTANRAFAREISAWAFKELGVLKVGRIEHHQNGNEAKPSGNTTDMMNADSNAKIYRVKSDVVRDATSFAQSPSLLTGL